MSVESSSPAKMLRIDTGLRTGGYPSVSCGMSCSFFRSVATAYWRPTVGNPLNTPRLAVKVGSLRSGVRCRYIIMQHASCNKLQHATCNHVATCNLQRAALLGACMSLMVLIQVADGEYRYEESECES